MIRVRGSLLSRVAVTFALSVALTALALSFAAYYLTKSAQDARALEEALRQSRQNLTVAEATLPAEPVPADYESLMTAFGIRGDFDTLLQTGTDVYRSGLDVTAAPVTPELAEAVSQGNIRYQSVAVDGEPTIVVGSLLRADAMTIYFFFPQGARLADLADLRNVLIIGSFSLALLGAVGGYLLARRLLSPVRQASRAALRMSGGDLDVRLPPGNDEFGVLAESFNQMAANLQSKVSDLEAGQARERRFVADVSHELRTPLSALVGEASLLKARLDHETAACPEEIAVLARLITGDIGRLRQLVDDLLEISRLDAQAAESVIEPVELVPFLAQVVQAHGWSERVSLGEMGTRAGATVSAVLADKRRLERIVVNLIDNALAHGAPPIRVEARPEHGLPAAGGSMLSMSITDSGTGIPLDDLPHVFDRFYKADPSRASGRGSGLGLAIARDNARLLGGDVTAANAPGAGARFVVTLPAAE